MSETLKALLLGDIIGQPGCRALFLGLKKLRKDFGADLVVANGENSADGFGILPETANMIIDAGVDVITSGNHVWQKKDIYPYLDSSKKILRPANYPPGVPGNGWTLIELRGMKVGVINLQGRDDLPPIDCPFRTGRDLVRKIRQETPVILVDFHAENPEEKEALGLYLDGSISCLVGTHTHVQTADERILPKGTAYITDLGMTGPANSVIGVEKEIAVRRSLTQLPIKMEVADNTAWICGVAVEIETATGRARSIERIMVESRL
ncbi:MAG: TIGR00282 family metallophosphoesterase [Spirochaetales bacterium]|nr:TIGR00282 family metallophosphoesterase [Spirochaetales bacterium]